MHTRQRAHVVEPRRAGQRARTTSADSQSGADARRARTCHLTQDSQPWPPPAPTHTLPPPRPTAVPRAVPVAGVSSHRNLSCRCSKHIAETRSAAETNAPPPGSLASTDGRSKSGYKLNLLCGPRCCAERHNLLRRRHHTPSDRPRVRACPHRHPQCPQCLQLCRCPLPYLHRRLTQ